MEFNIGDWIVITQNFSNYKDKVFQLIRKVPYDDRQLGQYWVVDSNNEDAIFYENAQFRKAELHEIPGYKLEQEDMSYLIPILKKWNII